MRKEEVEDFKEGQKEHTYDNQEELWDGEEKRARERIQEHEFSEKHLALLEKALKLSRRRRRKAGLGRKMG